MLIRALARALALASVAVSVAACEYSPTTVDRTLAYNQAIAESTNDLFLLNAVRAFQRQPTYYTRNTTNTSTGTVTPTISGVLPWGGTPTKSIATATSTNPIGLATGFGTVVTATKSVTQAALNLTSSLTGTTSNQLTLTNTDDQPSMQGLLTTVTLQQIANYLNEGFSPQELYLLYLSNISVPKKIVDNLPNAVAETCAVDYGQASYNPSSYCQYFFGPWTDTDYTRHAPEPAPVKGKYMHAHNMDPGCFVTEPPADKPISDVNPISSLPPEISANIHLARALKDAIAKDKDILDKAKSQLAPLTAKQLALVQLQHRHFEEELAITLVRLKTLLKSGGYPDNIASATNGDTDASSVLITYVNDPAASEEPPIPFSGAPRIHSKQGFTCFKQVLTALLALGLNPASSSPEQLLYSLPLASAQTNSRYFADLTTQKFDIAIDSGQVGVCQKASDLSLTYTSDDYINGIFGFDESILLGADQPSAPLTNHGLTAILVKQSKSPNAIKLDALKHVPAKTDCASALKSKRDDEAKVTAKSDDDAPSIGFTPRSLEAMVYYLGQIIRSKYPPENTVAPKEVTFWNFANMDDAYEEELFDVKRGNPGLGAVSTATAESGSYFVPKLCPDGEPARHAFGRCSPEYPNHASAQILTMLNQLWGLNKTQATAPIVAPVTVINPG